MDAVDDTKLVFLSLLKLSSSDIFVCKYCCRKFLESRKSIQEIFAEAAIENAGFGHDGSRYPIVDIEIILLGTSSTSAVGAFQIRNLHFAVTFTIHARKPLIYRIQGETLIYINTTITYQPVNVITNSEKDNLFDL